MCVFVIGSTSSNVHTPPLRQFNFPSASICFYLGPNAVHLLARCHCFCNQISGADLNIGCFRIVIDARSNDRPQRMGLSPGADFCYQLQFHCKMEWYYSVNWKACEVKQNCVTQCGDVVSSPLAFLLVMDTPRLMSSEI